ncbi:MAG TPA: hypothetical protein VJ044_00280 [Candidatus Hodarchaeales archaeon]|nr:hypothetical protein [Candidatus Hodarchaeales archaeon]
MPKFKVITNELHLKKELNDIDLFVIKATDIIKKYTDYVIVSGYVAIFFGRSRGSEDVDIFIKELPYDTFATMFREFCAEGFEWVADDPSIVYNDYLAQGLPAGAWEKGLPLLRLDMKFPKEQSQRDLFKDRFKVRFSNHLLWMASIESTIAYKEQIAKSEKDLLDAQHLREVFEFDEQKIEKYKRIFHKEFEHAR